MLADYHVHSSFSDDSTASMESMVLAGISMGLDEIAFTEHVDYGVKTDSNCDYESYFLSIASMRKKYGDLIRICSGAEFGVQVETIPRYVADVSSKSFDFILMSCHEIGNLEFWNGAYQAGKTQDAIELGYYSALLSCVREFKSYSVLAHLDLIRRYDPFGEYPFSSIVDLVSEILSVVIADGKGIEVNTSSFGYGLADLMPSVDILKLYRSLGGEIVTIGSDAHVPGDVGAHIAYVREVLRSLGFKYFSIYSKGEPFFMKL